MSAARPLALPLENAVLSLPGPCGAKLQEESPTRVSLRGPCGAKLQEKRPTHLSLRGPCGAKHQKGIPVQYAALQ